MKVSGVSSLKAVNFGSTNSEDKDLLEKSALAQVNDSNSKNKKVVAYSLVGLAALGGAIVLINNARHGKLKTTDDAPIKPIGDAIDEAGSKLTEEAKKALEAVKTKLDPKNNPKIDAEFIDRQYPQATKDENIELYILNRDYARQEKASDEIKAKGQKLVSDLEAFERRIDPNLAEKTDTEMTSKLMPANTREEMQNFYTEMAERHAKYDAMMKLKAENPQEYARLKAERAKAQKLEKQQKKAALLAENTKIIKLKNGTQVKRVIKKTSTGGTVVRDYSIDTDKLVREVRVGDGKTVRTIYGDNSKITFIKYKYGNSLYQEGNVVQKMFEKNAKGQYELISREVSSRLNTKTVTRLQDGNTEIIVENAVSKKITVVDKKGNILSNEIIDKTHPKKGAVPPESPEPPTVKALAKWYIEYTNLCKEFGVLPRPCGKGGAWDHFYELSLRKNDPAGYESYLNLRNYRSQYNEKEALLVALARLELIIKGQRSVEILTKEDVKLLKQYVEVAQLEDTILVKFQKIIKNAESAIAVKEQRELNRQRQRQSESLLGGVLYA